jgi:hypothetical protein
MKKSILIIGSALMMCLTISSCGGKKALDINVDDLNSACDFVDALELIANEMVEITVDGEIASGQEEQMKKLVDKVDEVSSAAESSYPVSEARECPNWDRLEGKVEMVEEFM